MEDDHDGLTWRLWLHARPHSVFCALIRATTQHGRLAGIEDYGRAVRFTPSRGATGPVLVARLADHDGGTLVQIVPVGQHTGQDSDVSAEAESVGSLAHELREYLTTRRAPALV